MLSLLWTVLIGLVAGLLAKWIMPGKDPGGWLITILLGIGGAVLATYLGKIIGIYEFGERSGLIGAVVGAVIILGIYRLFQKRSLKA
jgi:uncharacterized membrane protein YeaQ/YmgE (transglycosylase-associated protein family)